MNRVTRTASLLGATALALSVTACGSDSGSGGDYCDELQSIQDEFSDSSAAMDDPDMVKNLADSFQSVADVAPDEVKSDWDAIAGGFQTLSEVDMSDPEAMQDPELQEKLQGLQEMETNMTNIEEHAKNECDVDLGATSEG